VHRVEVVPGDVIRLGAGDLVPADARLLEARDLHLQQSALTGESMPVEKEAIFGDVATRLSVRAPETEFDRGIKQFGSLIMKSVFLLVMFILVVSLGTHRSAFDSLLFAVALAVGLTPEFLPMITSVTLARGAVAMAKHTVIVKQLSAIQNLGSIDILCSDKTGTLTRGVMEFEASCDALGNPSDEETPPVGRLRQVGGAVPRCQRGTGDPRLCDHLRVHGGSGVAARRGRATFTYIALVEVAKRYLLGGSRNTAILHRSPRRTSKVEVAAPLPPELQPRGGGGTERIRCGTVERALRADRCGSKAVITTATRRKNNATTVESIIGDSRAGDLVRRLPYVRLGQCATQLSLGPFRGRMPDIARIVVSNRRDRTRNFIC
jgi:hypothetical protein